MVYVGIDVGRDGFVSTIFPDRIEYLPMPIRDDGEIDAFKLVQYFANLHVQTKGELAICVEDVHAMGHWGAKANFNFGYNVACVYCALHMVGVHYTKVVPQKWQKKVWGEHRIMKEPKERNAPMRVDAKETSIYVAKLLFPDEDLRKTGKCKRPHDGKADSLLIAEYCRQIYN